MILNNPKKILFLTGTRADFGKIKSLLQILEEHDKFKVYVFVTGMHLMENYGYTLLEVERCKFKNIKTFENHTDETTMDLTLSKTIEGLSLFLKKNVQNNDFFINLYGDKTKIEHELNKFSVSKKLIKIVHSSSVVSDDETPLSAVKNIFSPCEIKF